MIYSILRRILARHAWWHLVIPLLAGIGAEIIYTRAVEKTEWSALLDHFLSGPRIALYIGIVGTYLLVIIFRIWRETNIGLKQLDLHVLADRLTKAKSIFAIGTMDFNEWFDPAVQAYLATIYERKLRTDPFRYERVLLLGRRSAMKNLRSDYLDGYHAKCLIHTHKSLGIKLYFLKWSDIIGILNQLTPQEKAQLGYYPSYFASFPDFLAKGLIWFFGRRRRVRKTAVGMLEMTDESESAFLFSKHARIVNVQFYPEDRIAACAKFVQLIKETIYQPGTDDPRPECDFTNFF
jgi:hypothetical protein